MAFLDDLQKRMSTPGADRYSEERFRKAKPTIPLQDASSQTTDTSAPLLTDIEALARARRRRLYMYGGIGGAVIAIALLTLGGIYTYQLFHTVSTASIDLSIAAPTSTLSSGDVEYTVTLRNKSHVEWENVTLDAKAPDGFLPKRTDPAPTTKTGLTWDIGTLRPKESRTFLVAGILLGEEGTSPQFTATATLTPKTSPEARIPKTQFATVQVSKLPINVAIEVPNQAASGEHVKIHVVYENTTNTDVTGARIVLTPPEGFVVDQAVPPITNGKLQWDVPTIPQHGQGDVTVTGFLSGDPDTVRPFKVELGFFTPDGRFIVQNKRQASTTMARRALIITQQFNGAQDLLKANPADEVNAQVTLKNTGDIGLRDVVVKLAFTGKGIDGSTVKLAGGFYDSTANTITWTAGSVPGLKSISPRASVPLPFTFRLLAPGSLPYTSQDDKNFAITSTVTADSPDIPTPVGQGKDIVSDRFQILVNSVLGIQLASFYDDGRTLPQSTGPLPPHVGAETIYTIRARITNTSNDVVDASYTTTLPEGIRWTNNKYTTKGDVVYNERTREVRWNIPLLASREGVALPAPEFAFQVGITPSLNQIGDKAPLTRGHAIDGTDAFTAAHIHADAPVVTTELANPNKADVTR